MSPSEHALLESSDIVSGTQEEPASESLPLDDALAAQVVICKTLSALTATHAPDGNYLHSVFALDRQAKSIGKALVTAYVDGKAEARPLDPRFLISARLLSRSFVHAYQRLVDQMDEANGPLPRKAAATVLQQLFRHRRAEFLLRLLRYKKRNSEQWRQLHQIYRMALEHGLECEAPRGVGHQDDGDRATLQQQYIETLLLGTLDTGQFSPRELTWATGWIARWSTLLTLQPMPAGERVRADAGGFVVQLDSAEGLVRARAGESADLHVDIVPLAQAIDHEIAALNATPSERQGQAWVRPGGGIALLSKLKVAFAPKPVHITRRGERTFVASSLDGVAGFKTIVQVVRDEARTTTTAVPSSTGKPNGTQPWFRGAQTIAPITPEAITVPMAGSRRPKAWQVKDWSDSGCRLRGRTSDLNDVIPGALMSIREHQAEWIIAIVRRLRRLMVDHVEISLEFVGRGPRFVKLVESSHRASPATDAAHIGRKRFGALYLPVSERSPTMPVKSLIVPVAAFKPGQSMKLASSTVTYALRFNKAFEEHGDFVWTTFTLLEKLQPRTAPAKAY